MYITTRMQQETNWGQVAAMAKAGTLNIGDEITDTLKNGEEVTCVVAHITESYVHFISKDCLNQKYPWNKHESTEKIPAASGIPIFAKF